MRDFIYNPGEYLQFNLSKKNKILYIKKGDEREIKNSCVSIQN